MLTIVHPALLPLRGRAAGWAIEIQSRPGHVGSWMLRFLIERKTRQTFRTGGMMAKALIDYALYLRNWQFEGGDSARLEREAEKVYARDFDVGMAEHVFCPNCFTPITRRPLERDRSRDNKLAYYAHIPSYLHVPCVRRTPPAQGELFTNEETAREAIGRGDLIVFSGFSDEPQVANAPALPYAQGQIEDPEGPETQVAITRHVGDEFFVPGRHRTVLSICRNFDQNLERYYQFPGQRQPSKLSSQLRDVLDIEGEVDEQRLYFGEIERVVPHKYTTVVWLRSGHRIKDFALPASMDQHRKRGITHNSVGSFVLFWGQVFGYGIGYCARVRWGEYAILPPQYIDCIQRLRAARAEEL